MWPPGMTHFRQAKRLLGRPRLLTGISRLRSVSAVFQNPHSLNRQMVCGRADNEGAQVT